MSEMVDRIATALTEAPECSYKMLARIVISSMREPTEAMVNSGTRWTFENDAEDDAKNTWQAMIDEALE